MADSGHCEEVQTKASASREQGRPDCGWRAWGGERQGAWEKRSWG